MVGSEQGVLARSIVPDDAVGDLRPHAELIHFPVRRPSNRIGVLARIETLEWSHHVSPSGLSRVTICDGPEDEIGDYVLVYEEGREWASWGVSRDAGDFCMWRTGAPGVIGRFPTIRAALDAILTQPRRRRRRPFPVR